MTRASFRTADGVAMDGSVRPVHPDFRVVALASPPTSERRWLHPEVLSMFSFHTLSTPTVDEVCCQIVV
jgi:hypothetical protein